MSQHLPASFGTQNSSRLSHLLRAGRRARLMAVALAGVWLWIGAGTAVAQTTSTTYLDADLGQKLEDLGRVHEDVTRGLKSGARQIIDDGTSRRPVPVLTEIIKVTQVFSVTQLQPAGNSAIQGGGINIGRDGSCVVGYQDNGTSTQYHAFRWLLGGASLDLGTLDTSNSTSPSSFATDTNQDCSVVVGISDTAAGVVQHAFRWVSTGGATGTMVDLNSLAGASGASRALGVSSNGTVVVGDAEFPAGAFTRRGAFRWAGSSFTDLVPGTGPSLATAVSADGTVVVGQTGTTTASSAFRWTTQNPVAQPIGPLPGHATAAATGVSDNGKIVVGISNPNFLQYQGPVLGWNQGIAFRWTAAKGVRELRQELINGGVNMDGIALVTVTGMSPDGQWIQGQATTPQTGQNETVAFIAQVCDDDIGGPCSTTGAAPFTLDAAPKQLTVSAGNSGITTITVTPNVGFAQPVSFSCGNLPVGAACSFNPATVTPPGTVSTTLTITTNGGPVAMLSPVNSPTMFAYALTPLGLMLIGALWYRRRADTHTVWMAVLLISVIAMASCSSSDSTPPATNSGGGVPATGTPAGTSTIAVTASSGGSSSGLPITLNVTR